MELRGDDEEPAGAPPALAAVKSESKRGNQAVSPIVGITNYTREERLNEPTIFRERMGIQVNVATKHTGSTPRRARRIEPFFLLKRLGFAAKPALIDEYERIGLNPYHYAILAAARRRANPSTQAAIADALGYDRGTLVEAPRRARGAGADRAQAQPRRPAPPPRPPHNRRQEDARKAPCALPAAGGRVPRAARRGTARAAPRSCWSSQSCTSRAARP